MVFPFLSLGQAGFPKGTGFPLSGIEEIGTPPAKSGIPLISCSRTFSENLGFSSLRFSFSQPSDTAGNFPLCRRNQVGAEFSAFRYGRANFSCPGRGGCPVNPILFPFFSERPISHFRYLREFHPLRIRFPPL